MIMVDLPKLWTLQAMTLGKNGMILAKNIEVVVIACALVFLIIDHANSCDVFLHQSMQKKKEVGIHRGWWWWYLPMPSSVI